MGYKKNLTVSFALLFVFSSCSIQKLAIDSITSSMTGSSEPSVLLTEEDPEFAKQSFPFALKLYEALLNEDPTNDRLLLTLAQGFTSYSNAFVESPARRLGIEQYELKQREFARAKAFYIRAYGYALRAMEVRHRGFKELWESKNLEEAFYNIKSDDAEYLYWLGTSLLAAISIQPSDPQMSVMIPQAVGACVAVMHLNPYYGDGAIHEMFVRLLGSLDTSLWWRPIEEDKDIVRRWLVEYYKENGLVNKSEEELIEFHFKQAITLSGNKRISPYISYAQAVFVPKQDRDGYVETLKKGLAIETEKYPEYRLENEIAKETCLWLLQTLDDIFI